MGDKAQDTIAGQWATAGRYEIRDVLGLAAWGDFGRTIEGKPRRVPFITPARGSTPRIFDPWDRYGERRRSRESPWLELVRIAELAGDAQQEAVKAWVADHGLLGIMLHEVSSFTSPAVWMHSKLRHAKPGAAIAMLRGDPSAHLITQPLRPVERYAWRTPRGWGWHPQHDLGIDPGKGVKAGDAVPGHAGHAVVRPIYSGEERVLPVVEAVGPYFPGCEEYPQIFSKDFWKSYSEPLERFVAVCSDFRSAYERVRKDPGDVRGFDNLMATVTPSGHRASDGRITSRWLATSMVGAMAMMAVMELGARWPCRCVEPTCKAPFLGARGDAIYCSKLHKDRMLKRADPRRVKGGSHGKA